MGLEDDFPDDYVFEEYVSEECSLTGKVHTKEIYRLPNGGRVVRCLTCVQKGTSDESHS